MYCPNCDIELDEEDLRWACPFCGSEGYEPYIYCKNCECLVTRDEELWECQYCENMGGVDIREWLQLK